MRAFFNIWVISTVLLYYFGPIEWPGRSEPWVGLFICTCVTTFNLGYLSLTKSSILRYSDFDFTGLTKNRYFGIIFMATYAALSLYGMQLVTGQSIISVLTVGFELNKVYSDYMLFIEDGIVLSQTQSLLFLLKALLFPIALILFCEHYKKSLLIGALFFLPMIFFSLARGTDKETFDLILILCIVSLYIGITKREIMFLLVLAPSIFYLFSSRKLGRFGGDMPSCLPDSITCFDFDSILSHIDPLLEIGFKMAAHYITQGYEGLNIAFNLEYDFHFGIGHLPPIKSYICGIFNIGCELENFNSKLLLVGWDTRYRWSTAYTTLANDFHWVFVPLYTFFIGWTLRLAEQNWRQRRDSSALAVIVLIGIFTLYSSANMQLAISLDWAFATIFLLYGKALTVRTDRPKRQFPFRQGGLLGRGVSQL